MVALTFATGMLDAVGYLGLDRVFTGNMTGNVVILGMGLAAAGGLPVAGPLAALGGYVCGAAVVGRAGPAHDPSPPRRRPRRLSSCRGRDLHCGNVVR